MKAIKVLKLMKKHRSQYFPLMEELLKIYQNSEVGPEEVNIHDQLKMRLILELFDLGYLEPDAFCVEKSAGDILSIHYNGLDPVTLSGRAELKRYKDEKNKRSACIIALQLVFLLILFLVYYFIF